MIHGNSDHRTTESEPFSDATENFIEYSKLPKVIRWGNWGILISLAGLVIGGAIFKIVNLFFPGFLGNGIPPWLWPILILIWTPGALGLLVSFYSIARYPYLSMATDGGDRIISSSRSPIWTLLGVVFYLIAPLQLLVALANSNSLWEFFGFTYLSLVLFFAGFLMANYRRERHITIATFLELTFRVGVVLFPLYIPAILIGSIRCRQFSNSINREADPSATASESNNRTAHK